MISDNYSIEEFDPLESSDEVIELFFDLTDEWSLEEDPDDPLFPRDVRKKFLLDPHPNSINYRWLMYPKGTKNKVVGYGNLSVFKAVPSLFLT